MAKVYKYYNRNPDNARISDCVCRAISTATGLNYEAVNNLLSLVSESFNCNKLCIHCYNNLLEKILCYRCIYCDDGETVEDIARMYPRDRILVRIEGHLTCI